MYNHVFRTYSGYCHIIVEEYVDATQFLSIRKKWTDEVRNGKLYFKQKFNCGHILCPIR